MIEIGDVIQWAVMGLILMFPWAIFFGTVAVFLIRAVKQDDEDKT